MPEPMTSRPTLCIGVLAMNEARRINACLASASFADQLLVIDSGSSDNTCELASAAGAEVHVYEDWQGFAEQRNRLLGHVRTDYIFFLDADEVIPEALRDEILAAISSGSALRGEIQWNQVAFGRPLTAMVSTGGLERLFREMGGELYTGVGVQRVMTEGKRACGVLVDNLLGSQNCFIAADVVVSNLDASTTYTRLVPSTLRRKYNDKSLAAKEYGCSGHLLYLGVKDLPKSFLHHEVLLSQSFEQTLREIGRAHV